MTKRPFALSDAVTLLSRTPPALNALLRDVPGEWTSTNEGPETWSPFDVIGHLIHGERTDWMPRLKLMLEDGPVRTFEPFDRMAQFRNSAGRAITELLDEFAGLRLSNLRDLERLRLGPADFDRRGLHPALGAVTVKELLATWLVHDYDHIVQIARIMANQYSDEVGPWKAYLRVVSGKPG